MPGGYTCFVVAPGSSDREAEGGESGDGAVPSNAGAGGGTQDTLGMRVVELDGARAGPVDCGAFSGDLLDVSAMSLLLSANRFSTGSWLTYSPPQDVAKIVQTTFIEKSSSVQFNLMYLGQAVDGQS